MPFTGGVIDGFPPTTPAMLDGIWAAGNGQNLVITYLVRQTFSLTAQQASEPDLILENLMDDGVVVYLNGTEIYRTLTVAAGLLATTTLVGVGNELTPLTSVIDLSGVKGLSRIRRSRRIIDRIGARGAFQEGHSVIAISYPGKGGLLRCPAGKGKQLITTRLTILPNCIAI